MSNTDNVIPSHPNSPPPLARPERKATVRLGQRHLSLLSVFAIGIVVAGLLWGAYLGFVDFKVTRDTIVAEDNMRALYKAMNGYAMDTDERFPTADKWTEQVTGYLSAPPNTPGGKMAYLHGEDEHGGALHYVYNDLMSGYNRDPDSSKKPGKVYDLSRVVLLIEAPGEADNAHILIPPRNTPQGEEALLKILAFPHNAGDPNKATAVIIYANGTTDRITRKDLK